MIKDLRLKNFQSHVDTRIEFHPGVTVITGASDVGKSSVFRALRWVSLNKPPGDALRRHKTKGTLVELDGVEKYRSISKTEYRMGTQIFKALRSDIPDAVFESLNLTDINFQEQHASYFLISESAGQVARTLNDVADLQVIDLALKEIKHKAKTARAEKKHLGDEKATLEAGIDNLSWVEEASTLYSQYEKMAARVEELTERHLDLVDAYNICCVRKKSLERIPDDVTSDLIAVVTFLTATDNSAEIQEAVDQVVTNEVFIPDVTQDLGAACDAINGVTYNFSAHRDVSFAVEDYDAATERVNRYPEVIDDPTGVIDGLRSLTDVVGGLSEAVLEQFTAEDCADEAEANHEVAKREFGEKMKELKVCPLCEAQT